MKRFQFPAWVNPLLPAVAAFLGIGALYYGGLVAYAVHPLTSDVGYRPEQPVPFSHAIHAGKLKMDCRYCHTTVESAAFAAIPPVATCLNCHSAKDAEGQTPHVAIHTESPRLAPIRESAATGDVVPWRKVHDLPDYAYFNHSAHVARGRVLMSSFSSLYCFRPRASLALWNGGKMRRAGSLAACSSALRSSRRPVPMRPAAVC